MSLPVVGSSSEGFLKTERWVLGRVEKKFSEEALFEGEGACRRRMAGGECFANRLFL